MSDLNKLHGVLLDLLKTFDNMCKKHDIRYFVIGGTLLGTVRHSGFIPWDDDIDVGVFREDYDKLLRVAEFEYPYSLSSMKNDRGSNLRYYRLRNNSTTYIPIKYCIYGCNQGSFIDIFPLDNVPDDARLAKKQADSLNRVTPVINYLARYGSKYLGTLDLHGVKKLAYYMMLPLFKSGIINGEKAYNWNDRGGSKYQDITTNSIGLVTSFPGNERFIWAAKDFKETIYMNFEDMRVPVPKGYDNILRKSYGDDYMTPKQAPSEHGQVIFDTEIPWEKYVNEHREELKRLWIKSRNEESSLS